jgi:hypothetical protein
MRNLAAVLVTSLLVQITLAFGLAFLWPLGPRPELIGLGFAGGVGWVFVLGHLARRRKAHR